MFCMNMRNGKFTVNAWDTRQLNADSRMLCWHSVRRSFCFSFKFLSSLFNSNSEIAIFRLDISDFLSQIVTVRPNNEVAEIRIFDPRAVLLASKWL